MGVHKICVNRYQLGDDDQLNRDKKVTSQGLIIIRGFNCQENSSRIVHKNISCDTKYISVLGLATKINNYDIIIPMKICNCKRL